MNPKVISSGVRYSSLPESYKRPESERPRLSEVVDCDDVPVIDMGCKDRPSLVRQIGDACKNYGFFQVTYHGVTIEAVESMCKIARDFFDMPVEEKLKLYSDDPSKTMRLSTSFNVSKEKVHNWRDYLRLHCYPLDKYVPEWPSNPLQFKLKCNHLKIGMPVKEKLKLYSGDSGRTDWLSLVLPICRFFQVNRNRGVGMEEAERSLIAANKSVDLTIVERKEDQAVRPSTSYNGNTEKEHNLRDSVTNCLEWLSSAAPIFKEPISLDKAFEMLRQRIFPSFGSSSDDLELEYWKKKLEELDEMLFLKYKELEEVIIFCLKKLADFIDCPFPTREEIRALILEVFN